MTTGADGAAFGGAGDVDAGVVSGGPGGGRASSGNAVGSIAVGADGELSRAAAPAKPTTAATRPTASNTITCRAGTTRPHTTGLARTGRL